MVTVEAHGSARLVRLDAPENRFNPELLARLEHALDEVEADPAATALVTTGNGRFFSNGLDLEALAQAGAAAGARVVSQMQRVFARLLTYPLPTIAAVDGHAFAGGAMFALAHDWRVMREDRGWLCINEIDLATGQAITHGMHALLASKLAPALLHEMVLTGRRYTGPDAVAAGLAVEACGAEALEERALALAGEQGGKHRATLAALKQRLFADAVVALGADDVFA